MKNLLIALIILDCCASQPPDLSQSVSRLPVIRYSKLELARIGLQSELRIFKSDIAQFIDDVKHPEEYLEQKLTDYFVELIKEEAKKIAEAEAKKLLAELKAEI